MQLTAEIGNAGFPVHPVTWFSLWHGKAIIFWQEWEVFGYTAKTINSLRSFSYELRLRSQGQSRPWKSKIVKSSWAARESIGLVNYPHDIFQMGVTYTPNPILPHQISFVSYIMRWVAIGGDSNMVRVLNAFIPVQMWFPMAENVIRQDYRFLLVCQVWPSSAGNPLFGQYCTI